MEEKGFLDKVLQFMGIQEEAAEEPERESPAVASSVAPQIDAKRRARLVSLPGPGRTGSQLRVAVMQPRAYEEVQQIADHLKERQPVIVSLEGLEKETSRRIIDFVSGTAYALDGSIHRIGEGIFLFAPVNVAIDTDSAHAWRGEELFS